MYLLFLSWDSSVSWAFDPSWSLAWPTSTQVMLSSPLPGSVNWELPNAGLHDIEGLELVSQGLYSGLGSICFN